ncbi:MAG: hypothetical protein MJ175_08920, partial [Clostridia bacterium]|nr:hypothetical protein [Clostridia bacterium]
CCVQGDIALVGLLHFRTRRKKSRLFSRKRKKKKAARSISPIHPFPNYFIKNKLPRIRAAVVVL